MDVKLEIVKRIASEKSGSELVRAEPRNELQRVRLSKLYELLLVLRLLLTLNLQTGWVHQDEFTNSIEVIAGDYFDLRVFPSPGFNRTFPTRSIAFLHVTVYVPYVLTHRYLTFIEPGGKEPVPDPFLLILVPRLFSLLLSLTLDLILVRWCRLEAQFATDPQAQPDPLEIPADLPEPQVGNHKVRLLTLASSAGILVLAPRTHAALLNSVFYAGILYLVSEFLHRTAIYSALLKRYQEAKAAREKVLLLRQVRSLGYRSIRNLHWISLLVVAGLFNDPEFLLSYAVTPLFFYFQAGISNPGIGMTAFHARLFLFLTYFFGFCAPFVVWDSVYYKSLSADAFTNFDLSLFLSSFVVTPANYFATRVSSFPRDLSLLPQTLLTFLGLYNVLGLLGLLAVLKEVNDLWGKGWKDKPRLDSQWTFLTASWVLPLVLFVQYKSAFDLLPLLVPLVMSHGHKIPLLTRLSSGLGLTWFAFNLGGLLLWGYGSQGGILDSFLDLNRQLTPHRFNATVVDILLAGLAAIPPTFVLVIPKHWKTLIRAEPEELYGYERYVSALPKTVLRIETESKVRVFHTGVSTGPLCQSESQFLRLTSRRKKAGSGVKVNFLLSPSSLHEQTQASCFSRLRFKRVKTYWSHVHLDGLLDSENVEEVKVKGRNLTGQSGHYYGLNLYRFEDRRANGSISEADFRAAFPFQEDTPLTLSLNTALLLLTTFLFLMSFLTFLM